MPYRTIYKYPFSIDKEFTIRMPSEAEILCVQMQNGVPHLWAIVDTNNAEEERRFNIYGTGWPRQPLSKSQYIGTFQDPPFVWHLFEND